MVLCVGGCDFLCYCVVFSVGSVYFCSLFVVGWLECGLVLGFVVFVVLVVFDVFGVGLVVVVVVLVVVFDYVYGVGVWLCVEDEVVVVLVLVEWLGVVGLCEVCVCFFEGCLCVVNSLVLCCVVVVFLFMLLVECCGCVLC